MWVESKYFSGEYKLIFTKVQGSFLKSVINLFYSYVKYNEVSVIQMYHTDINSCFCL